MAAVMDVVLRDRKQRETETDKPVNESGAARGNVQRHSRN